MKQFKGTLIFAGLIIMVSALSGAFARDTPDRPESTTNIGLGFLYDTSPYKGDDDDAQPIPMIFHESKNWYFKGRTAGYKLFANECASLDLIARYRPDGYKGSDSSTLSGMSERRSTVDVGAEASYFDGWGRTKVSFVTDLLGNHDGQEVELSYGKRFGKGRWSLTPSVGVLWQSSNLTNYYYGVRGKEARVGRPRYSTGEAWNPFVGFQLMCEINEQWSTLTMFRYEWLDDEIQDSPIVNDNYEILVIFGVMYKF
ncbi:MAG: MipA/OmpV family protein [Planctomycetota bacterium]